MRPADRPPPQRVAIVIPVSTLAVVLSLVTLTFLSLFLLMERPAITSWLFGFTPPETEARWRPVVEDSIQGSRPRSSATSRSRSSPRSSRVCRHGRSGCPSPSSWR